MEVLGSTRSIFFYKILFEDMIANIEKLFFII